MMVEPTTGGPSPHDIHTGLIGAVHHALRFHPDPAAKAEYGNILAKLLQRQAKLHATAGPQAGGARPSEDFQPDAPPRPEQQAGTLAGNPILSSLLGHAAQPAPFMQPAPPPPLPGLIGRAGTPTQLIGPPVQLTPVQRLLGLLGHAPSYGG